MSIDTSHAEDARDIGAIIPAALDDYGLTPHEFRVYSRIARRAGKGGGCWESVPNMATACRMNKDTVRAALRKLEAVGMIAREERPGTTTILVLRPVGEWAHSETEPLLNEGHPDTGGGVPKSGEGTPPKSGSRRNPLKGSPEGKTGAAAPQNLDDPGMAVDGLGRPFVDRAWKRGQRTPATGQAR